MGFVGFLPSHFHGGLVLTVSGGRRKLPEFGGVLIVFWPLI